MRRIAAAQLDELGVGRGAFGEADGVVAQGLGKPGALLGAAPGGIFDVEAERLLQRQRVLGDHALQVRAEGGERGAAALLRRGTGLGKGGLQPGHRLRGRRDRAFQRVDRRQRAADLGAEPDLYVLGHPSPRNENGAPKRPWYSGPLGRA